MANRARPTLQKRERERARLQKQKDKEARRLEAKARKDGAPRRDGSQDPDLAGIVPGPQPLPPELQGWEEDFQEDSESES